jgi:hypothetical protein
MNGGDAIARPQPCRSRGVAAPDSGGHRDRAVLLVSPEPGACDHRACAAAVPTRPLGLLLRDPAPRTPPLAVRPPRPACDGRSLGPDGAMTTSGGNEGVPKASDRPSGRAREMHHDRSRTTRYARDVNPEIADTTAVRTCRHVSRPAVPRDRSGRPGRAIQQGQIGTSSVRQQTSISRTAAVANRRVREPLTSGHGDLATQEDWAAASRGNSRRAFVRSIRSRSWRL